MSESQSSVCESEQKRRRRVLQRLIISTSVSPVFECMNLNINCPVSADNTLTAEENTSDPSGANQVAAMQNSPTGPSGPEPPRSPKRTGGSKQRHVGDKTCFRTTSCPGPSSFPFSEVYEVGEKIGKGGFSTVYEGIWKCTGEQVAIKCIAKFEADGKFISLPGCSKPLLAEVALNLLLNEPPVSPYIVHMLDWFEEKDRYILILEYPQPCKDLQRFVVSNIVRMNESLASDLIYQAVLGAKHSLDLGVFHQDIKLNNFLINTTTNQVKLIDFGIADLIKSSYFGEFRGLCHPLEYYNFLTNEAEPTTVWSLGDLMYRMVCNRAPFESVTDMSTPGTLKFNSTVSRECQDLISRCLSCDPTKRATIEEILQHEWFQQGQMSRVAQEQLRREGR